jgi:hypothetical protein
VNNKSLAPAALTAVDTDNGIDEPKSCVFGLSLLLKIFSSCVHCDVCYKA